MGQNVNLVEIGGIKFNKNEIKNVNVKNDMCMSGSLYTVETNNGTFTYRDFPNSIISGDEKIERSILGSNVSNCTLEGLKGTDKQDKFTIKNSVVDTLDLSGDSGNRDCVYLVDSYIQNKKQDNDDKILEYKNLKGM